MIAHTTTMTQPHQAAAAPRWETPAQASANVGLQFGQFVYGCCEAGPFSVPCIVPCGLGTVWAEVRPGAYHLATERRLVEKAARDWLTGNEVDLTRAGAVQTGVRHPPHRELGATSALCAASVLALSRYHRIPVDPHQLFRLMCTAGTATPVHLPGQLVISWPESGRLDVLAEMPALLMVELGAGPRPHLCRAEMNERSLRYVSAFRDILALASSGDANCLLEASTASAELLYEGVLQCGNERLQLAQRLAHEHRGGVVASAEDGGLAVALALEAGPEGVLSIATAARRAGLTPRYYQTGLAN